MILRNDDEHNNVTFREKKKAKSVLLHYLLP